MVNIGSQACGILVICFLALAFVFQFFKGKSTILLSGFNTLSKKERLSYDTDKIAFDTRNKLLVWAGLMAIGTLLCALICRWIFIIFYIVWLILVFKDFHFDTHKNYERYKQ